MSAVQLNSRTASVGNGPCPKGDLKCATALKQATKAGTPYPLPTTVKTTKPDSTSRVARMQDNPCHDRDTVRQACSGDSSQLQHTPGMRMHHAWRESLPQRHGRIHCPTSLKNLSRLGQDGILLGTQCALTLPARPTSEHSIMHGRASASTCVKTCWRQQDRPSHRDEIKTESSGRCLLSQPAGRHTQPPLRHTRRLRCGSACKHCCSSSRPGDQPDDLVGNCHHRMRKRQHMVRSPKLCHNCAT